MSKTTKATTVHYFQFLKILNLKENCFKIFIVHNKLVLKLKKNNSSNRLQIM